jgi:hypothetical protein
MVEAGVPLSGEAGDVVSAMHSSSDLPVVSVARTCHSQHGDVGSPTSSDAWENRVVRPVVRAVHEDPGSGRRVEAVARCSGRRGGLRAPSDWNDQCHIDSCLSRCALHREAIVTVVPRVAMLPRRFSSWFPRGGLAALAVTITFTFGPALLRAQAPGSPVPTTKLATVSAKQGVVLLRGSTEVGFVDGRAADAKADSGSVTVDAVVLTEVGTGTQTMGLNLTLEDGRDHARSVWVDDDELGGLTRALDYLATVDSSATPLAGFEAAYRTRGALRVATYSDVEGVWAKLSADGPSEVSVPLPRERLATLRSLVQRAAQLLVVRPRAAARARLPLQNREPAAVNREP